VKGVAEANRGPITAAILMAMVMGALDATIANIALPHMQGSLSASPEQITWVVTSFIVATVVAMPVSGWMVARLGLKPMLLINIGGFTFASILCGLATSLPEMVVFRILQGMTVAALGPLAQAVLLNINPPERAGRAMALLNIGAVVAPVLGPVIGGYLTEQLSWRWCFYINVPTGIAAMLLLWVFLPSEEGEARPFDVLGFASLAISIGALQLVLDRGPTLDWFSSREICVEAILAIGGFWVYLTHTLTAAHPLFDPAIARDRNLVATTGFSFFVNVVLFASLTLLPLMMQIVLGYPVMQAALVSTPRGLIIMVFLLVMGRLDALVDRRLLLATGVVVCAVSFWQMGQFDLSMTSRSIVLASMTLAVGQGIIMVPLSTLAFATISPALRAEASTAMFLVRNIGSAVGVSATQALVAYNGQSMHAALAAHVIPSDPVVRAGLPAALSPDTVQGALALNAEITRQATMVAYVDAFRMLVFVALASAPLLLFLRSRRMAGEGAIAMAET
jgi:DHA2 family multidrug resistance protein